jgi:diacylglycerol kinase family enzyme
VLTRAGRRHELWKIRRPQQLETAAGEAMEKAGKTGGIVVAAGGDGTINAVAQAVLGSQNPFGLIPRGTFNYFARAHGIPTDTADAVSLLLDGIIKPVRVGLVNDRIFLVNASLGLYPRLIEDRETTYRLQRFGRSRVVALCSALVSLFRPHRRLIMELQRPEESKVLAASTLFVANNPLQLEQLGVPEAEAVRQGRLAGILLEPVDTLSMVRLLVLGALGKLGGVKSVITFAFSRLTVRPHGRRLIKVAIDGEIARLETPLLFRVSQEPLQLVCPLAGPGSS